MILRVFIVEDEEMIRKGLVHTINWSDMGCLVVGSAADGRSGLSGILQKRPDVVITDIRMPEMDGLEMLERALSAYSFRIILLTSYADFDYARRAIALRACDYLLKPLDEDKLASLMSRIHSEEETAKQVRRLMPLLNGTCKSASLMMEEIREQDAYVDVALNRIVSHSEQRLWRTRWEYPPATSAAASKRSPAKPFWTRSTCSASSRRWGFCTRARAHPRWPKRPVLPITSTFAPFSNAAPASRRGNICAGASLLPARRQMIFRKDDFP